MGYKIPDLKEDIKNNISDFIYREWYNEGEHLIPKPKLKS